MRLPWQKPKEDVIPTFRMLPPDTAPPPTLREELRELYNDHKRFDDAYRTMRKRYPKLSYKDIHEEWEEMKKEERNNGWW